LVLSEKAKKALEPLLCKIGEFLPLLDGYWLFNCLDPVGGDAVDHTQSKFEVASDDSLHIPKVLVLKEEKIAGKVLFKPGFGHNSFLLCDDVFKDAVEQAQLGGVHFEKNLAKIFL
jgi:hypothetical protein